MNEDIRTFASSGASEAADGPTHTAGATAPESAQLPAAQAAELARVVEEIVERLADGLDHPEVWTLLAQVCNDTPGMAPALLDAVRPQTEDSDPSRARGRAASLARETLIDLLPALIGDVAGAAQALERLMGRHSQSPLVQGALFYVRSLQAPADPRYQLTGKVCPIPFLEMDVLEGGTHLCCASWLPTSVGNLFEQSWESAWNSAPARQVRESVLDGSYRHCNKITCPVIQRNDLLPADRTAPDGGLLHLEGAFEYLGVRHQPIPVARGWLTPVRAEAPAIVNLSYDRSCNLSCPSCRREPQAASGAERSRIEEMQERNVKPLLANARLAMITGSGDPFASKSFRGLLDWISPETTPQLEIKLMTNGLLLDEQEWGKLQKLHDRVAEIKVSIDGASADTHELLRRGSHWPRMLDNLAFIGRAAARNPGLGFVLAFIVQKDNFHEMGAAVDLARQVGATGIQFARLTNWGTFTPVSYRDKAVFLPTHPLHAQFLDALADPRLDDPRVNLGDLAVFRTPQQTARGPDPNQLYPVAGDQRVCFLKNAIRNPNIVVGDYTYYDDPAPPQDFEHRNVLYHYPFIGDKLIIGKYCAIARDVRFIMNGANHGVRGFSSYLFPFFGQGWEGGRGDPAKVGNPYGRGDTLIGNDVWIGYEAMIMPGVKIGDGAVIGARSVVASDVPAYAIVAGNPARVLRARFDPDTVELLQAIRWWDWPAEDVTRHLKAIVSNDLLALRAAAASVRARRLGR